MSADLTTPISETVVRWELIRFDYAPKTGLFTVSVRLSNLAGDIVRESSFGAPVSELGLLASTLTDIRQSLRAFLVGKGAIN